MKDYRMRGQLFVDGQDAYLVYGVYVANNTYTALLAWPPLKEPDSNDWQEEDGAEYDLEAPVLNSQDNIAITFAVAGVFGRYEAFIEKLSDGAYHTFNFAAVGRTFRLRLTAGSNRTMHGLFGTEQLKFSADFPMEGYAYEEPQSNMAEDDSYLIDDTPTTVWGMRILQGTIAEIVKSPEVKQNMLRNKLTTVPGVIYDPAFVTYKAKEVKLTCLMRAESLTELWRNYDALLYTLVQPGEHILSVAELSQEFPFYYKECKVSEFFNANRIWLKFTITIVFTGNFRIDEDDFFLATEDLIPVITEDGDYFVDVFPDYLTTQTEQTAFRAND